MKQFLKFVLASIAGTIISGILLFVILIIFIGGAISTAMSDFDQSGKVTKVEDNTILHLTLDQPITDRGPQDQFNFDFGPFKTISNVGLNQILENIEKAKNDDKITGIFLDISFLNAGMGTVEEIRNKLQDFKSSEKWIISYSEVYSQKAYYLASVSDEIFIYPEGVLDFRGLNTNIAFLKGTMEKLEIEPQIIRGSNNKFKSAVEPFILDEMSQANRAQTEQWMGSIWSNMLAQIAASRGIGVNELQAMADSYEIQDAQDAVANGLATKTKYYDEVLAHLKFKTETEEEDDLKSVSLGKYIKAPKPKKDGDFSLDYKKDKIAVVYASGAIASGESADDAIGSETFAKAIRDARRDTAIKAIVLRVNSGGGSALASDVIWRETSLAKEVKPLVVSMGDVAASGGYYIAADADEIFAMPNTITGSIGVFGILPNMKGFFNNKLGMTFDGVKTGKFADFGELTRPLTDAEYAILQKSVDRIYDVFLERVSDGRSITKEEVDEIGQGRVWSGVNAMDIQLVDRLGGLEDAIARAAELAEITDYTVRDLPKRKDPFQKLLEDLNAEVSLQLLKRNFGDNAQMINSYKEIQEVQRMSGVQARLPYTVVIE
ncbi:MAG: signal peptide peptidase SppA [Cryomorphaceae bacterium]|nr:signal peptide peptidase SppA [Flavobacteriales bacterium]